VGLTCPQGRHSIVISSAPTTTAAALEHVTVDRCSSCNSTIYPSAAAAAAAIAALMASILRSEACWSCVGACRGVTAVRCVGATWRNWKWPSRAAVDREASKSSMCKAEVAGAELVVTLRLLVAALPLVVLPVLLCVPLVLVLLRVLLLVLVLCVPLVLAGCVLLVVGVVGVVVAFVVTVDVSVDVAVIMTGVVQDVVLVVKAPQISSSSCASSSDGLAGGSGVELCRPPSTPPDTLSAMAAVPGEIFCDDRFNPRCVGNTAAVVPRDVDGNRGCRGNRGRGGNSGCRGCRGSLGCRRSRGRSPRGMDQLP